MRLKAISVVCVWELWPAISMWCPSWTKRGWWWCTPYHISTNQPNEQSSKKTVLCHKVCFICFQLLAILTTNVVALLCVYSMELFVPPPTCHLKSAFGSRLGYTLKLRSLGPLVRCSHGWCQLKIFGFDLKYLRCEHDKINARIYRNITYN